jgi:hypothetical protein
MCTNTLLRHLGSMKHALKLDAPKPHDALAGAQRSRPMALAARAVTEAAESCEAQRGMWPLNT